MLRRLLPFLLILAGPIPAVRAADIPDPASLPEKLTHGDSEPTFPAEAARRLLAGKALLERGELERAREEFNQAQAADDLQPLAYFYQAVAAYRLGDYPAALQRAEGGLGVLRDVYSYGSPTPETDAQQKRFTELRDAIQAKLDTTGGKAGENPEKKKQEFAAALQEGDEAYAHGLMAKAAAAYARAYRADPTQGEIGLRAATLHADRLKNLLEAATLWQQVVVAGEPHATAARAELQLRRDALDAVLRDGLSRREKWRRSGDPAEALRLAAAFPESTELQVELAILFARKGQVNELIAHLQAASRLGLGADEFLAQVEFLNALEKSGGLDTAGGQRIAGFVRDAYGEDTLGRIRTELKRRVDETARLAREKAEQENRRKLATERTKLTAWRDAQRSVLRNEANQILSRRNGIEVEVIDTQPAKNHAKRRHFTTRSSYLLFENDHYHLKTEELHRSVRANGAETSSSTTFTHTFRSFGGYLRVNTAPSNWIDRASPSPMVPVEPHRRLCRVLDLIIYNGGIFERSWWRDGNGDVTRGPDLPNNSSIGFHVMLEDAEFARLQQLFARLAQLDAAGDNLEKLRGLQQ